jgi:hypothetical protein
MTSREGTMPKEAPYRTIRAKPQLRRRRPAVAIAWNRCGRSGVLDSVRIASGIVLVVGVAALVLASTGTSATRCPTTGPNRRMPEAGMLGGLFGNGRMAASAYRVIRVTPRTRNPDGSIGEKFWWYAAPTVKGDLKIRGHRLDRRGGKVTGNASPGSDPDHPNLRFWATGVRFPTVGCWRVVGTAGSARLALTVLVRR